MNSTTSLRARVAAIAAGIAVAVTGVSVAAPAQEAAAAHSTGKLSKSKRTSATPLVSSSTSRRGFWYAIGDSPTVVEVDAAPAKYGVVVLNPWETWALRRIKQADPTVTVLVYKDLSSTRSYHLGPLPPTGVATAEAQPDWFATSSDGQRIQWEPYPGHWQMTVWDAAYQDRWVANVLSEVVSAGWDGVLADNDLGTLKWYSSSLLSGTSSVSETDQRLRDGLDVLVDKAGRALRARGKVLVPNLSDGRLYPGRWAAHATHGGGMEENFVHWGTDPASGFLWDWGPTGWVTQTDQLAAGPTVAVTRAAFGDTRTLLYGYASLLVRGGGDDYWMPSTTSAGDYTEPESLREMSMDLGPPTGLGTRGPSGAWTRSFQRGWAAVNPTQASVTLTPPRNAVDSAGRRVHSVTLLPTSGAVLRVVGQCRSACPQRWPAGGRGARPV